MLPAKQNICDETELPSKQAILFLEIDGVI